MSSLIITDSLLGTPGKSTSLLVVFSGASVTIQPTAYSPTASCRVQTTFSGHVNNVGKSREFTPKGARTEKDEFLP